MNWKERFCVKLLAVSVLFGGFVTAVSASMDNEHPALVSVRAFYASAEHGMPCSEALAIRPAYSEKQCDDLLSQHIRELRLLEHDNAHAKVYVDVVLETKEAGRQHIKETLPLRTVQGQWQIMDQQHSFPSSQDASQHNDLLANLQNQYAKYAANGVVLVDVSEQMMYFYRDQKLIKKYPVSTGEKGEGSKAGSDKTPLGAHRVSERYGDGAPLGTIFKARQNTGKVAKIIQEPIDVKHDYVTTRILWLDGLEKGKNKGPGIDSHSRYIYIHGTAEEGLIGQKASHGCVRMKNADVVDLYGQVPVDALVYIQH